DLEFADHVRCAHIPYLHIIGEGRNVIYNIHHSCSSVNSNYSKHKGCMQVCSSLMGIRVINSWNVLILPSWTSLCLALLAADGVFLLLLSVLAYPVALILLAK